MCISVGRYNLKKEFFPLIGANEGTWTRRRQDLLEHLEDFFDFEIIEGRPMYIEIKAVYGEYQKLPRKSEFTKKQKQEDYKEYVLSSLNDDWKLTSKAKEARDAISSFGEEKYKHNSPEAVARRYVGPVMNEYGENDNNYVWVRYDTYERLSQEVLDDWREILREHHIDEQDAANAFYRQAQGEDISAEIGYFALARDVFMEKYGTLPVRVSSWRLKRK